MSIARIWCALALLLVLPAAAAAQETAEQVKRGAQAYRICAACHSLQPGVHLSGPSLAGLWGKKAASVEMFGRYTKGLKKQDIVWDVDTLNAWLADPQAMVPGTTMAFRGIENDDARGSLIAFLRKAMAPDGAAKVVKEGLIPEQMASGQIPPNLKSAEPDERVTAIRHCGDAYYVTTGDGREYPFWETNVRIKIDTSTRGPNPGAPVLVGGGMVGDRVSVVFSSLAELKTLLAEKC